MALNLDKMKSKLDAESKSNFSSTNYDRLNDGKNVRRILWPKGDKEEFWSEGYVHYNLGPEGKSLATCPKTFNPKAKCPICEYVESLKASKDKDDKKLMDDIKAKRKIYINVLNRDAEDEVETPKVLGIGVTILKGLLEAICDPDYGDITDFEDGRDMTIKKTGKSLNTEYSVLPKPKSSVASEELSKEEIEESMADLDSLFIEKSYDELEALLNGDEPEEEEYEEDEESTGSSDADYDDMTIDELEALCKKRKIKVPARVTRIKLITLLTEDDEAEEEVNKRFGKAENKADPEDDSDELQNEITKALENRKKR